MTRSAAWLGPTGSPSCDDQRLLMYKGGFQDASLLLRPSSLKQIKSLSRIGTKKSWLLAAEWPLIAEVALTGHGHVRFWPEADVGSMRMQI